MTRAKCLFLPHAVILRWATQSDPHFSKPAPPTFCLSPIPSEGESRRSGDIVLHAMTHTRDHKLSSCQLAIPAASGYVAVSSPA
eukprot:CAMPEP_0174348942 /NCGR_PEP_ID=MMETSP0811_2-20130205/5561_1 /TAXON_ID=73025 ORGANISM="Eutreptiella gymnastica-like, Strain CCMP1594" /NCGR_SAMPLE_ID=MMETSP0811_2 /ASSEMBLY_ACC=CAM_ASM_000667 /LENGTH=83 /DNA_ID=CAMNT_0015475943 /DNA_START=289 /DNA_END=540 /DNA_ORIENTATION=-